MVPHEQSTEKQSFQTRSAQPSFLPSLLTQQQEKDTFRNCASDLSCHTETKNHEGCHMIIIAEIRQLLDIEKR